MKKQLIATVLFFTVIVCSAQIKVHTGGSIGMGFTSAAPLGGTKVQIIGNTIFTSTTGSTTSSPYIIGRNATSTSPDFTWRGDSTTGFSHPSAGNIGLAISGTERVRFASSGFTSYGYGWFFAKDSTVQSAAYVRGRNLFSSALVPDYTWWGNDQTGFFHPALNVIGFSISGAEKMRIHSNGKVAIGTTSPSSLFCVGGNGLTNAQAYIYQPTTTTCQGLLVETATPGASNTCYSTNTSITAGAGAQSYGIRASAYNSSSQSTGLSIGVYGQAGNVETNCGVWGQLLGSNGNSGAGVYGSDNNTTTAPTFAATGPFAGYFRGAVLTTNDSPKKPSTGSWIGYSDIRLKKDTTRFKDGLNVLRQIKPVSFKFNGIGNLSSAETRIGIIAQELLPVAPYCIRQGTIRIKASENSAFSNDIVSNSAADSSGESYSVVSALMFSQDELIYVTINAVKQLDSTVTRLKQTNDSLRNAIAECCSANTGNRTNNTNTINPSGTLNDQRKNNDEQKAAILYQNVPNPFNQSTLIKCFIPEQNKIANLLVFDMNGILKRTIPVNGKGEQNININGKELVAGMYFYSLIIDGREIDTKKMILTE
jgi:hypothetical protein